MLIFTSGTSGDPKAVPFAHVMAVLSGSSLVLQHDVTPADVCYLSMPLFHSNGVAGGWSVAVCSGATMVPAKFSASRFPQRHSSIRGHLHELRRQAAGVGARYPRAARRRRQPAARRLRQRGCRPRHRAIRAAVRLSRDGRVRLQRVRGHRGSGGRHPARVDRQGLGRRRDLPRRRRDRVCHSGIRRDGCAGQLRRSGGRTGQHHRRRRVRRLLQRPRRHQRADAPRHVLVRRSRLPRRRRMDLPCRTHRRLDARRR